MTGRWNPADYDTVESRIRKFWADHANGRVLTDLVYRDERQYIVRAEVYTDRDDTRPAATGYAEEIIGSSAVNKTAALENAETSAIGRALANINYAAKARPSANEMGKADRQTGDPADLARAVLRDTCATHGWDLTRVAGLYADQYPEGLRAETDAARIEKFRQSLSGLPQAVLIAVNGVST